MDRDSQKGLMVLLTLLTGLALFWVVWQVLSPILHTLILIGIAAVLAFALSGPVTVLAADLSNRLVAIVLVYLLVGTLVVGGLTLLGRSVRRRRDVAERRTASIRGGPPGVRA